MALTAADRETLIRRYGEGPSRLRAALAAVPGPAVKWRPKPGEWSAHEVVCHCADSETNAYARIRYLTAEPEPLVVDYNEAQWAITLDYHAHPLDLALATVEAVRANTLALLRRLPDTAWTRVGRHTASGRYAAEDWLRIYAAHLEDHAAQIDANVAAWKAQR